MLPLLVPPFAAAPAAAGITYTMSGIAVGSRSRVRTAEGSLFPNLFAVGGAAGGAEGGDGPLYFGCLAKAASTAWRVMQTISESLTEPATNDIGPTLDQRTTMK